MRGGDQFQAGVTRFRSTSFEGVAEFLHQHFGAETVWNAPARANRLLVDVETMTLGCTSIIRANLASYDVVRSQREKVQIIFPLSGVLKRQLSSSPPCDIDASAGAGIVCRPYDSTGLSAEAATVVMLNLPLARLLERGSVIIGREVRPDVLTPSLSPQNPLVQALKRSLTSKWAELAHLSTLGLAGIVESESEQFLTNLTAAALFADVQALSAQNASDSGAGAARRARDRIAADASGPVSISDIAAELGVSLRSLQETFQRHYGCSPRKFLMTCRLNLVRDKLLHAPHPNISDIALSCGFSDLGAFSARYREAFGELPSQTVRYVRG